MECELCGRQTEERYIATIENVELRVCPRCAKGHHVTEEVIPRNQAGSGQPRAQDQVDEMVEDYGMQIRRAREHMKIPVKVLAEMISEKEGVVTRVEQQKMVPPEALRKKIEKALGLKLAVEGAPEKSSYHGSGKAEEATLGEFVN